MRRVLTQRPPLSRRKANRSCHTPGTPDLDSARTSTTSLIAFHVMTPVYVIYVRSDVIPPPRLTVLTRNQGDTTSFLETHRVITLPICDADIPKTGNQHSPNEFSDYQRLIL